jgi:multidrug resistance efflux pump
MTDKLESYRINYNKAQSRLATASKEIQRLNNTNSELLSVVTIRNREIKRKDDQLRRKDDTIRDLKARLS